jgi:hypothetical protein
VKIFRESTEKYKRYRGISAVFIIFSAIGGVALAASAGTPGPPGAWPPVRIGPSVAGDPAAGQRVWSVALRPGDRLAVRFQTRGTTPVRLCVLSPLVQDADAPAPPALRCATARPGRDGALGYVATRTAAYGLDFVPPGSQPVPYSYTVVVTRRAPSGGEAVGGATIATAPLLTEQGSQFGDTLDGERFWRLSVPPHSQISVSWANNGPTPSGELALLGPGASAGARPIASQTAGPSQHVTLAAVSRLGGRYVLDFAPSGVDQSYSFVVHVSPLDAGPLRTAVAATLPTVVHGRVLKTTAVVRPASAQPRGRCRLEVRRNAVWRSLVGVPVRSLGRCSFRVSLRPGQLLLRVRYVPSTGFAGSASPPTRVTVD